MCHDSCRCNRESDNNITIRRVVPDPEPHTLSIEGLNQLQFSAVKNALYDQIVFEGGDPLKSSLHIAGVWRAMNQAQR